ncbi:glycosyltransferase [Zoogloea sp.]|uniref:glycosyltransferase n=1 Tax=Zoogloea sp. TaxID=49181 RepID=UPI0035AE3BF0
MRVLHFYKTFLPDTTGGVEQVIRQLCLGGRQYGIESRVLTLSRKDGPPEVEVDGIPVTRLPQWVEIASCPMAWRGLGAYRRLARWADVIHLHYPWPFGDLVTLLGPRRPIVITYHSDVVAQQRLMPLYRPLKNRLFERAFRVVATSPQYAMGSAVLRRWESKLDVVPLGIDPDSYPQLDPQRLAAWRARLGEGFFLFVGVFRHYKGLPFLLDAVKGTGLQVAMAGEGPLWNGVAEQVRGWPNVHLLGRVSDEDKMALLSLCRGIVFPSHLRAEAFGVFLIEAAMVGKPMISCDIGTGSSYVNVDGETGLVIPPQDPLALRNAMQRLADDALLAERLGQGAARRFDDLFRMTKVNAAYAAIYRAACKASA